MPASYLHGVETIEIDKGPRPVKSVKSAVIGLIGTAPIYDVDEENRSVNNVQLILSEKDGVKYFGQEKEGYTIPHALKAIFTQGAGEILAINVFNPFLEEHRSKYQVTKGNKVIDYEELNFEECSVKLSHECVFNVEIVGHNNDDFDIDYKSGEINFLKKSIDITKFENNILSKIAEIKSKEEQEISKKTILSLYQKADPAEKDDSKKEKYNLIDNINEGQIKKITSILKRINYLELKEKPVVRVKYDYADPAKVTPKEIIGGIDDGGNRIGLQAYLDCYGKFGFFPKILISPIFCTLTSVVTELDALAHKIRAIAYVDAPIGVGFQEAIIGRGPEGTINFASSSPRVRLLFPHLKAYNPIINQDGLVPYSPYMAGIRARVDLEQGYWKSASNKSIRGITGTELQLSAMINDPTCEVNLLNENGITSVFNSFGTGMRTWGNRTASWPSLTSPKNFENVRRTADMIEESLEYFMLQFMDETVSNTLIDTIVSSVNAFIRTLVSRGAIIDGTCWFDPADNPSTEIAAGHLTFSYDFMPPTPAERITFKAIMDIKYLEKLGG